VTWTVHETNVSQEEEGGLAMFAEGVVLLAAFVGLEALGRGALGAAVEFGVGVTQFDGDLTDLLLVVANCLKGVFHLH
jgi:hypothetical protein